MPLWGVNDDKTSTGTIEIDGAGVMTGTGTDFVTEAKVGDFVLADSTKFKITGITDGTTAQVVAAGGAAIVAVAAGEAFALQEAPSFLSDASEVFGVDAAETAATDGIAHPGWVKRTVGTGGRSGRVTHETLVASKSITSDADDDTEYPDA